MGKPSDESRRRRAERSAELRRIALSGFIAVMALSFLYYTIFIMPSYKRWHANTFNQGGLGLFLTAVMAVVFTPFTWAVAYVVLLGLGIPRVRNDPDTSEGDMYDE